MKKFYKLNLSFFLGLILLIFLKTNSFSESPSAQHIELNNYNEASGHIFAVDIKTGKEKWRFKTKNFAGPSVVSNGIVYFGKGLHSSLWVAINVVRLLGTGMQRLTSDN